MLWAEQWCVDWGRVSFPFPDTSRFNLFDGACPCLGSRCPASQWEYTSVPDNHLLPMTEMDEIWVPSMCVVTACQVASSEAAHCMLATRGKAVQLYVPSLPPPSDLSSSCTSPVDCRKTVLSLSRSPQTWTCMTPPRFSRWVQDPHGTRAFALHARKPYHTFVSAFTAPTHHSLIRLWHAWVQVRCGRDCISCTISILLNVQF